MSQTVLWDYPKSSASYRVRIALNLAGVDYRIETVNLLDRSHRKQDHLDRNPQGFVPVLDIDGHRFTQSLAILEYLDTTRDLRLLPKAPALRAKVKAAAHSIAVDIHPVCNLSVATKASGGDDAAKVAWMQHFITPGLRAFESLIGEFGSSRFCTGDAPSLADVCLIPQLYNARRWDAPYDDCPKIMAAEEACATLTAFSKASPD